MSGSQTGRLDGAGGTRGLGAELEGSPSRSGCCKEYQPARVTERQKLIPPSAEGWMSKFSRGTWVFLCLLKWQRDHQRPRFS